MAAKEQCGKEGAQDCGIEEVCLRLGHETRFAISWRWFMDYKYETRAVKETLKKAGIGAEVRDGRGDGIGDYLRSI